MIHDDRALLVVDLSVDACVPDEVDNPLLAFGLREVQSGREVPGLSQYSADLNFVVLLFGWHVIEKL